MAVCVGIAAGVSVALDSNEASVNRNMTTSGDVSVSGQHIEGLIRCEVKCLVQSDDGGDGDDGGGGDAAGRR